MCLLNEKIELVEKNVEKNTFASFEDFSYLSNYFPNVFSILSDTLKKELINERDYFKNNFINVIDFNLFIANLKKENIRLFN